MEVPTMSHVLALSLAPLHEQDLHDIESTMPFLSTSCTVLVIGVMSWMLN